MGFFNFNTAVTGFYPNENRDFHKTKKPKRKSNGLLKYNPGGYLLFHAPAHAVPSAYKGLTFWSENEKG